MVALLLGVFALFVAFGTPIAFSLGLSACTSLLSVGTPLAAVVQRMFSAADSFPLMAVPFFMLAGKLMEFGGISKRIVRFAVCLCGFMAGGLGVVTTLACMFFGAICGSSTGTVAAIGSVMLPAMEENNYDRGFAGALLSAAGGLGILIPPSIPMIIYAVQTGASVADLFLAGIVVGILSGLIIIGYVIWKSKRCGYKGTNTPPTLREVIKTFLDAFLALLMPVIVLGGIYGGFFTPTEAAAVACLYGFIVGFFVYRAFKLKDIPRIVLTSAKNTAIVMLIISASTLFGWQMTVNQVPQSIAAWLLGLTSNPIIIMVLLLIFLIFVGTFMEGNAYIVILAPILTPIIASLDIGLVQFGIIMVVSVCVGCITPPLGVNMFTTCGIMNIKLESIIKNIMPFVLLMALVLFLVAFIPQLTEWPVAFLSNLTGG